MIQDKKNSIGKFLYLFLLIIIFSVINTSSFAEVLKYDIYHYTDKLHIRLEFKSFKGNITELIVPSNIWGHEPSKQIKNIKLHSVGKIDSNNISHEKDSYIIISYDIINIDTNGQKYYSYIDNNGFYFIAKFALIYPRYNQEKLDTIINFSSPSVTDIVTSASYRISNKKKIITNFNDLINGFIIAGNDKSILVKDFLDTKIITFNLDKNLIDEAILLLDKINNAQTKYFEYSDKNNIFVLINNKHATKDNYYGTVLKDRTVIYFLPSNSDINNTNLKHLISHENLHKWIGRGVIRVSDDEEFKYKWFTEGFVDYLSDRINLDNEIITYDEYITILNKRKSQYIGIASYTNDNRNNMQKMYWENNNVRISQYIEGSILAADIDEKIKKFSENKMSLRDVMKQIIHELKKGNDKKFTTELLQKFIREIVGYDIEIQGLDIGS